MLPFQLVKAFSLCLLIGSATVSADQISTGSVQPPIATIQPEQGNSVSSSSIVSQWWGNSPNQWGGWNPFVQRGCALSGCHNTHCVNQGTVINEFWCPQNYPSAKCFIFAFTQCMKNNRGQCDWVQTPQLQRCLNQMNNLSSADPQCKIDGCGQEICTEIWTPWRAYPCTLIYKSEWQCYSESAGYTRCQYNQNSGTCEWKQTSELQKCLSQWKWISAGSGGD